MKANLGVFVIGSKTSDEELEESWKELQGEETGLLLKKFQVFDRHTRLRLVLDGIKKK